MTLGKKFSPDSSENASLSAVTTGTGKAIPVNDCRQVTWMVTYSGTTSGGAIVIEHAPTIDYAGTWQLLDTITAANLSAGSEGSGTYPGLLSFVRARITSNITGGGSITAYINGLLG